MWIGLSSHEVEFCSLSSAPMSWVLLNIDMIVRLLFSKGIVCLVNPMKALDGETLKHKMPT